MQVFQPHTFDVELVLAKAMPLFDCRLPVACCCCYSSSSSYVVFSMPKLVFYYNDMALGVCPPFCFCHITERGGLEMFKCFVAHRTPNRQ